MSLDTMHFDPNKNELYWRHFLVEMYLCLCLLEVEKVFAINFLRASMMVSRS